MIKTMTKSSAAMMLAAVTGLVMAFASQAIGQPIDGGNTAALSAPVDAGLPMVTPLLDAGQEREVVASGATVEPLNPAKEDPAGVAEDVYQSLKGGEWLLAFSGILMFLIWATRAILAFLDLKWFESKMGGFVLAFGTAFGLALATMLASGHGFSLGLFTAAAGAAWASAGKWGHLKDALKK